MPQQQATPQQITPAAVDNMTKFRPDLERDNVPSYEQFMDQVAISPDSLCLKTTLQYAKEQQKTVFFHAAIGNMAGIPNQVYDDCVVTYGPLDDIIVIPFKYLLGIQIFNAPLAQAWAIEEAKQQQAQAQAQQNQKMQTQFEAKLKEQAEKEKNAANNVELLATPAPPTDPAPTV